MAVTPASTSAVPRSGWRTTSTIKSSGMSAAGSSVCFQSRMASSRVCRNHARNKHQHRLGDLRGLEGEEIAEAYPAMRVMRAGNEEDQHQQHRGDAQGGIDESRRVVMADVHVHQDQQGQHARQRPDGLRANEGIGRVIALLIHHGGGGEDHHQPGHHQQHRGEEQPLVDAYKLRHRCLRVLPHFPVRRSPTSSLKTRPRCS